MPSFSQQYDHPNYTVIRQESKTTSQGSLALLGLKPELTFRSKVACVVTQISATTGGSLVPSTTLILTLEESLNTTAGVFTLAANRTLTAVTDRLEVSVNVTVSADAAVSVVYEYRIVPGSTYSLYTAI